MESAFRGCTGSKKTFESRIKGIIRSKRAAELAVKGGISSIRLPSEENIAKCRENARKIRLQAIWKSSVLDAARGNARGRLKAYCRIYFI